MNRRKTKYIRPDMQLKVVFITFFAASFLLLVNFQLNLSGLWSISGKAGMVATLGTIDETRRLLIEKFLITIALGVPLTVSVGILYSFSFSGPIYRFRRYFQDLGAGRWDARCTLRQGDGLQDLCEAINESLDPIWAQLLEDTKLLQESSALLDESSLPAGSDPERRKMLQERLRKAIAVHEERLGLRKRPAAPAPAMASASPERELEQTT